MIEARRRAYLEAMGLEVWVARSGRAAATGAAGRLQVGPGQGSTLLVCAVAADSAGKFAGDLARALGGDPLWAWPDPAGVEGSVDLEEAVYDRLITQVVLLGAEPARWLFPDGVPASVGSAAVTTAASVDEMSVSGAAKQDLWRSLRRGPMGPNGQGAA